MRKLEKSENFKGEIGRLAIDIAGIIEM